jgi:hypothetical protein
MTESEPLPADTRLRPRDLALLLLASGELLPRQRARDQQADRAGLLLKRRLLEHVAAHDPNPADLEKSLLALIEQFGPPTGPTRALATTFMEEWQAACVTPELLASLLSEATDAAQQESLHGKRERS